MGIEIERKFLLVGGGWRAAVSRSQRMSQGYLGGDRVSIRVRIAGCEAALNIKSRVMGHTRQEFEYPIPLADAETLLGELAQPGLIDKTRHHVDVDGHRFEVDEFHGENAGLIIAEIELSAADAEFPRPDWLGAEVTDQRRYYNNALSERPFAQWSDEEKRGAC